MSRHDPRHAAEPTVNPDSQTRYPFSVVRERIRSHSRPVIDFAFGGLQTPTPANIRTLLREQSERAVVRATASELDGLAEAAGTWFSNLFGAPIPSQTVLPCPGGRMAMGAIASTLLAPEDIVVVTEPTYPVFRRLASRAHAKVFEVPLDPDRSFEPDLGDLPPGVAANTRLLSLNYPNNPTAVLPTAQGLDQLHRGIGAEAIWFNDATYAPLGYESAPFSLVAAENHRGRQTRTLELHSLAKFFALGPLSAAFLIGDTPTLARVREFTEFAWSPMSSLQVAVARQCFEDPGHVDNFRQSTRERIRRLRSVLDSAGFETFEPQAGIYLLCRAPSSVSGRRVAGAMEAAGALLDDHDIAAMPWDASPHSYLRFSSMYHDEDLKKFGQKAPNLRISA